MGSVACQICWYWGGGGLNWENTNVRIYTTGQEIIRRSYVARIQVPRKVGQMAPVSIDDSVNQARKSLESCVQSSDEELMKPVRREVVENKKSPPALDQGELNSEWRENRYIRNLWDRVKAMELRKRGPDWRKEREKQALIDAVKYLAYVLIRWKQRLTSRRAEANTVSHIISSCPKLAQESKRRNDKVGGAIHWVLAGKWKFQRNERRNDHVLGGIQCSNRSWIAARRPDLVIKRHRCSQIIDLPITKDGRVRKKEAVKAEKCQDLATEVPKLRGERTKVIPVVVEA